MLVGLSGLSPQVSATRWRVHGILPNRLTDLVNTLLRRHVGPVSPRKEEPTASGRDVSEFVSVGRPADRRYYVGWVDHFLSFSIGGVLVGIDGKEFLAVACVCVVCVCVTFISATA